MMRLAAIQPPKLGLIARRRRLGSGRLVDGHQSGFSDDRVEEMGAFGFGELPIPDYLTNRIGFEEVQLNALDDVAFFRASKPFLPIVPLGLLQDVITAHFIGGVADSLEEQSLFFWCIVEVLATWPVLPIVLDDAVRGKHQFESVEKQPVHEVVVLSVMKEGGVESADLHE